MNKYDAMKDRLRERAGEPKPTPEIETEKVYGVKFKMIFSQSQLEKLLEMSKNGELVEKEIEIMLLL